MSSVVIAFPKAEVGQNIKRILAQSGYQVQAAVTTGGQALSVIEELDHGILVCGPRFVDMMYDELAEYLPKEFQMLLLAPAALVQEHTVSNLVCLAMPLKVHELLESLEMMEQTYHRRKRRARRQPIQRSQEEREVIDKAKAVLMERNGLTEEEAHRYIQKRSMENGTGLIEVAQMILSLMDEC